MTEPEHQILIVDDDPSEVVLLRRHLDRAGIAHALTACHDPDEVPGLLERGDFTVVILDQELGPRKGLDLLEEMASRGDHPPVVMLTGHGDESIAARALRAGAVDYLPKSSLSADLLRRSLTNAIEKRRLETVVARQRADLEEANAVLRRKNREMESFYHTVSHELKTPLTSTLEYVALVLEGHAGPTTEEQQDYLGVAVESARQMALYIDDLLDVTRLETGKMTIRPAATEIASFVERVVESLMPMAAERGIVLETEAAPELPAAAIDERRIAQVIRNLVHNALKFSPEGGRILVSAAVSTEPEMLLVEVSDTGRGIAQADCSVVFERLAQVSDDDFSTHGGLGLGLSICRDLVQLHGGRIWVQSEVGVGSTFSFTVPRHDSSSRQANLKAESEPVR